jgi:hypothetical protein
MTSLKPGRGFATRSPAIEEPCNVQVTIEWVLKMWNATIDKHQKRAYAHAQKGERLLFRGMEGQGGVQPYDESSPR